MPVSLVLPYLQYAHTHRPVVGPVDPALLEPFYPLAASPDGETLEALRSGKMAPGWEPTHDADTGLWYYLNHVHKTSSWNLPVQSASDPAAAAFLRRALRSENHPMDPAEGVGITVSESADKTFRIVALEDGGAAQQSGLVRLDDRLVSIDGVNVHSTTDAAARLRGQPGTGVLLELSRGLSAAGTAIEGIPWLDLVSEGEPDPANPESFFTVRGQRLTVPTEDNQGVFTVRDAETAQVVYRGHGRFEGVWMLLCSEGQPLQEEPSVFLWRGMRLRQPVYDEGGVATVTNVDTDEVVSPPAPLPFPLPLTLRYAGGVPRAWGPLCAGPPGQHRRAQLLCVAQAARGACAPRARRGRPRPRRPPPRV